MTGEKLVARLLPEEDSLTWLQVAIAEVDAMLSAAREERGCDETQERIVMVQAAGLGIALARSHYRESLDQFEPVVLDRLTTVWDEYQWLADLDLLDQP